MVKKMFTGEAENLSFAWELNYIDFTILVGKSRVWDNYIFYHENLLENIRKYQ